MWEGDTSMSPRCSELNVFVKELLDVFSVLHGFWAMKTYTKSMQNAKYIQKGPKPGSGQKPFKNGAYIGKF